MNTLRNVFTLLLLLLCGVTVAAEKVVYKINIKKEINATTWLYVREGFKEATEMNATSILIHMNTYGGEVLYADSIRTKILNSKIPVYVFIDNNAASAGALISIACDKIYMRPGGNIGAATVVNGVDGKAMPDKYQSYMRATIRATAEAQGKDTIVTAAGDTTIQWKRDPLIAEAMVDDRVVIPGISDSGKVLTFTALEAQKYGYCEGIAENVEEVLKSALGGDEYTLKEFKPSAIDDLKGLLMSSVVQAILIMLILGGIYYELQAPGLGFPSAVALVAAMLYFAPLYLDGLAAYWEIILFFIGLVLLAMEIFVIPGFGIAGVSGIVCVTAGLILSMLDNDLFNFDKVDTAEINRSVLTVVVGLFAGFILMIYLTNKIGHGVFRFLALNKTQEISEGYLSVDQKGFTLVGKEGVTGTLLRPSGKVIIDGISYDAISMIGYIDKDIPVKVIRFESGQIYVQKVE